MPQNIMQNVSFNQVVSGKSMIAEFFFMAVELPNKQLLHTYFILFYIVSKHRNIVQLWCQRNTKSRVCLDDFLTLKRALRKCNRDCIKLLWV